MIPPIIHQTSRLMTWEEMHLVGRIKRMMPDYQHVLWSDDDNQGLFERVFPNYMDEYLAFDRSVVRSDISRCLYMYVSGGIYCDTDFIFFKPVDRTLREQKCLMGVEEEHNLAVGGGYKVGNAFLASEPGLALWAEFVESIFYRSRTGENRVVFLSGPHALSLFLKSRPDYEHLVTFLAPSTVYPERGYMGLRAIRQESTFAAHLCWGGWRDKSLVHRMKNRARRCLSAIL